MQLSTVPYLKSSVTWKQRSFGSLFFKAEGRQKVYLNATATRVLTLVDGISTGKEIAATLATDYNIPRERAQADVGRLFDRLASGGWLTPDPVQGKAADSDEVTPSLDYMSLALTHRCNLRCRYCYVPLDERADAELTTNEWREVIQQIRPFKLMHMILTGGEPLLRADIWDIVESINAMNVSVILCTNGTLIDRDFVERAQSANISVLQISLDGASSKVHEFLRGAGTFERTWRGIELSQAYGLPVELICTVTQPTLDEYIPVVKLARQRGFQISINEYLPLGPGRDQRAELDLTTESLFRLRSKIATLSYAGILEQKVDEGQTFRHSLGKKSQIEMTLDKKQNCLGHEGGGHILPNGDMLVCPLLNWTEMVGGNVHQTPLREMWEHAPVFEQLRQLTVDNFATCQSCANRNLCGGTCRAITKAETGSLEGPPDVARCLWEQVCKARIAHIKFDSTEPFQTIAEERGFFSE